MFLCFYFFFLLHWEFRIQSKESFQSLLLIPERIENQQKNPPRHFLAKKKLKNREVSEKLCQKDKKSKMSHRIYHALISTNYESADVFTRYFLHFIFGCYGPSLDSGNAFRILWRKTLTKYDERATCFVNKAHSKSYSSNNQWNVWNSSTLNILFSFPRRSKNAPMKCYFLHEKSLKQ